MIDRPIQLKIADDNFWYYCQKQQLKVIVYQIGTLFEQREISHKWHKSVLLLEQTFYLKAIAVIKNVIKVYNLWGWIVYI